MAKKAAEGLARGLSPTQALREAGYPEATVNRANGGINKKIWTEFGKLGRRYIRMGRDLTPEAAAQRLREMTEIHYKER